MHEVTVSSKEELSVYIEDGNGITDGKYYPETLRIVGDEFSTSYRGFYAFSTNFTNDSIEQKIIFMPFGGETFELPPDAIEKNLVSVITHERYPNSSH